MAADVAFGRICQRPEQILQYEFGKGQKVDITESVIDYEWQSGFLQKVLLMSHRPDRKPFLPYLEKRMQIALRVLETRQVFFSFHFISVHFFSLLFLSFPFLSFPFLSFPFFSFFCLLQPLIQFR